MDAHSVLELVLVLLLGGIVFVPLAKFVGLGSVLGYLTAGIVIGPQVLALVEDSSSILQFSEFGVVMLLFIIGLELQSTQLWKMRSGLLSAGGIQLGMSWILFFALAMFLEFNWLTSLIVGFAFSLSSTAFVLQLLSERKEFSTPEGQNSFLILLFQDMAVIPFLALLPLMAGTGDLMTQENLFGFLKGLGAIAIVIILGLFILPRLLKIIARAGLRDLLTATALFLVFGLAFLMESVGLSMELGAFLGGVLLAESEFKHELEASIEPFKGLLMGFFFMAIGMEIDFSILATQPGQVLMYLAGLVLIKFSVLAGLGQFCRLDRSSQWKLAAYLSQAGEFAFVIFAISLDLDLIPRTDIKMLSLIVALSMASTPFLVLFIERVVLPRLKSSESENVKSLIPDDEHLVVVAGFGRVGQIVSRILRLQNIKFTALEKNPAHIDFVKKWGNKVFYGDASRLDLLQSAHLERAKVFVNAIDDPTENIKACEIVKAHFPHVRIIARARNRFHELRLQDLGVEFIYRETLESSISMAEQCLIECGLSYSAASETTNSWKAMDEKILKGQRKLQHDEKQLIQFTVESAKNLESMFQKDLGDESSDAIETSEARS